MSAITLTLPRLALLYILAVTVRLYALRWRHHLPPVLFAVSLTGSVVMHSFTSPWLLVSWATLAGAGLLSNWSRGPKVVFGGLLLLLALVFAAVPGSLLWGSGNWILSAGVALWMAPSIVFYLTSNGERVFAWLAPVWLFHAGLIIYQSFFLRATIYGRGLGENIVVRQGGEPTGLSINANLGAGFLVLGVIYLLTTRHKWLALPLILGLAMTGSRWAALVCVAVVVLMTITRQINAKTMLVGAGTLFAVVMVLAFLSPYSVPMLAGLDSFGSLVEPFNNGELRDRMAVPHIPSFLPRGIAEHPGLHNVPLRVAVENGILAAVAWVGVTGWALWARRGDGRGAISGMSRGNRGERLAGPVIAVSAAPMRFGASWWMLLALALLSVLDYYTWMGHLGGVWWLLVGIQVKRQRGTEIRMERWHE